MLGWLFQWLRQSGHKDSAIVTSRWDGWDAPIYPPLNEGLPAVPLDILIEILTSDDQRTDAVTGDYGCRF